MSLLLYLLYCYFIMQKICYMFVTTGHLRLRVVKILDSQYRVPSSNILGDFKIKVISAFYQVEVD